jgi:Uma2 family endonuclease
VSEPAHQLDIGFTLARDPDTVLCPDVAFVASERLAALVIGQPFPELAPDLAVEVLSPGDRRAAVQAKVGEYLAAGVRAVWVLDPATRTVGVHPPGSVEQLLAADDVLDGGNVVPGFRCPVEALFPSLPR